jgi:serine/threonine-protein kinase
MKPIRIGDVIDNYRVTDIVGSGGMGAVYKIENLITRRIEAMKLLPPGVSDDPEQARRFEREVQVQARLHHPNIAALYNAVHHGPSIALVMEFVEGESLQRMVAAGPLPVETALDFTMQLLRALAYAHDAGVIHRDVAPSNIIVTPEHVAKLTDFGLARGANDLRLSTSGVPLGSPWYMSPEQVRGVGELDARTDLYSAGAVLHEMLTGGKLFDVEGAFAVMRAHVEAEPASPSSRNPKVPAALDDIVRKAVAKDPSMRFQSADEFRLALQNLVAAAPPVEVPSRPRYEWRAALPRMTATMPGLRSWRAAMLMAMVPASLVAGFYTIRFFPAPAHVRAQEPKPLAAHASRFDVAPPAPAPPPVASPAGPETLLVVPSTPPEAAPETGNLAKSPRPRAQFRLLPALPPSKSEPSYAIRVTGEEALPPPKAPEPLSLKTDPAEAPVVTPPPPAIQPAPRLPAPTQENVLDKPRNTGNRFVRALGKVNPFRKTPKYVGADPAGTPPDQD